MIKNINESIRLALNNLQSGNMELAENLFKEILSVQPENIYALHFLGVISYQKKNYDLAIESIEKAIQLNPTYAEAYNNLGLAFQETGRMTEAITCYQKALYLKPDLSMAIQNLSNLLREKGYFETSKNESETIQSAISTTNKARELMREIIHKEKYVAISLGQTCNTAWYLRQVGVRTAAYPFDWIFSSAEIAESCLRDSFSTFLDKKYITQKKNGFSAGHSVYHANMFHHRSPLLTGEDYDYYVRCVERFNRILLSGERIVFVCTLINETDKNPTWDKGFCYKYDPPKAQSHDTYKSFMKYAKKINRNLKYIFIDQYTEGQLNIIPEMIDDDVLSVRFTSQGSNDGLKYLNDTDDFIAKLLYSGLIAY